MTKQKRKPRLPNKYRGEGERAIERHQKRPATPDIKVDGDVHAEGWHFSSPYARADEDHWVALLFDGFATRSRSVFHVFTDQLARLCDLRYDSDDQAWRPDPDQLIAAINIIKSMAPRNEAEACLAAQAVALHLATMKLGALIGRQTYPDERTVAIMGKTARTFAGHLETMDRLKGKRRTSKQNIRVERKTTIIYRDERQINITPPPTGSEDFGGRPHEAKEAHGVQKNRSARVIEARPEVRREDPLGNVVPLPSDERKDAVQASRRKGDGRKR